MVEGKWLAPGQTLTALAPFRETDGLDAVSWNAVVYADGQACAHGRIRYHEGDFLLEKIVVLDGYRHQGYGDLLLRLMLYKARQHAARFVRLTCESSVKPFFEKYGFKEEEDGSLLLMGEDICLDSCRYCGKCGR